jgi:hypothetical protein
VAKCPQNFFGHEGKGKCLNLCPFSFYGYDVDAVCITGDDCKKKHGRFTYLASPSLCVKDCTKTESPSKVFFHE